MTHAYICDAIRTPFGRYGGALSSVRTDDLGAVPLKALMARNPQVDWAALTDVIYGCANQAGEDNRNVARMSALLAGLPIEVPGGQRRPQGGGAHGSACHAGAHFAGLRESQGRRRPGLTPQALCLDKAPIPIGAAPFFMPSGVAAPGCAPGRAISRGSC